MHILYKKFAAVLCVTVFLTGMAACSNVSESSAATENHTDADSAPVNRKISVIINTTASEYWSYVSAGAKAYQTDHPGIQIDVAGPPSETSYSEQMNMIETALAAGEYDGMVISPLQAATVEAKLESAVFPVVSMNTSVKSDKIVTLVGTGNEATAIECGKAAVEAAKAAGWEKITAIAIAGTEGDPAGDQRLNGFRAGIEAAGGIFLADGTQYADWTADKAVSAMEGVLSRHPEDVAIIVACNDDMAVGAARAAKNSDSFSNTIFCGFDGMQSACEAILKGEETLSVAQDPFSTGYQSVDACVRAIDGKQLNSFIDTGCSIISIDNAQDRLNTLKSYAK